MQYLHWKAEEPSSGEDNRIRVLLVVHRGVRKKGGKVSSGRAGSGAGTASNSPRLEGREVMCIYMSEIVSWCK